MNPSRILLLGSLLVAGCECNKTTPSTDDTGERIEVRDRGQWLSMGVLANGDLVASYFDREDDGLAVAFGSLTADGVSWTYEHVDGFKDENGLDTGNRGTFTSLVVAPGDVIWVAYYDVGNGALRYARRHNTANPLTGELEGEWIAGVADVGGGASPDAGKWASIALDPDNKPVIAHYDDGEGELRVTRWDGAAFGNQVVIEGEEYYYDTGGQTKPADVGSFADLLITADGTEYIAHYDAAWNRLLLSVGGAEGYTTTVVDDEGNVGQWPSLHVADDGTVHIAYQDVTNQRLRYASGSGSTFTSVEVDDSPYVGADTEIFVNGDLLSVLYFDGQNNDMKLATLAAGLWDTKTLAGDDGLGLGYHNEVVLTNGTYYAGCYDYTQRSIWFGAIQ